MENLCWSNLVNNILENLMEDHFCLGILYRVQSTANIQHKRKYEKGSLRLRPGKLVLFFIFAELS